MEPCVTVLHIERAAGGVHLLGTVTIALSEGRRLNHLVSFNMIAAMTATYGIGKSSARWLPERCMTAAGHLILR